MSVINPLREIHRILDESHDSSIKVQDLYDLRTQPLDESFLTEPGEKRISTPYILEIIDLSYAYPDKTDQVLHKINLKVKEGEKIGIAGASGCGKTTLIKLLLRLVHGYNGKIVLLGKNLKSLTRDE